MKTSGIVLDTWKLPVFAKHLKAAGFTFEKQPRIEPNAVMLVVKTDRVGDLQKVVLDANIESERLKTVNSL